MTETGGAGHVIRVRIPSVAFLHPPCDRRVHLAVAGEIPVIGALHEILHRVLQDIGRPEVHVGDPHRNPVFG